MGMFRALPPVSGNIARFQSVRQPAGHPDSIPSSDYGTVRNRAQPSAAQYQAYFGLRPQALGSRFVKTAAVFSLRQPPRFGQRVKIGENPEYQTYQLPQPDGGSRAIRLTGGDPGVPGATWTGVGTNFALFSKNATNVELCLFNSVENPTEALRIPLQRTGNVWHGFSPDLKPGQVYAFRAHGPYQPRAGQRFNEHKLLLDPYAKAVARPIEKWDASLLGYQKGIPNGQNEDWAKNTDDSAPFATLGVVVDDGFDWRGERRPDTPWGKTVIYEAHVKGMTALHPLVPEELRGTYAGLATEPVMQHLKELGVTAIQLLPVHHHPDDQKDQGRANYWGYNTLGYFAPQPEYAADQTRPDGPVREFKEMVKTLHQNGFEVFLDVVYNHTAEGNELGPTLSMRGIDNQSYYHLVRGEAQYYTDHTGCGNTLDTTNPTVIKMIVDSLRYWVDEMHVDGFRFDLASALVRDKNGNVPADMMEHPLMQAIRRDPVLSGIKLIAEPWDANADGQGYRVGGFPQGWHEWNGKYRDDVRRFWRGDEGMIGAFATRLSGSQDLYGNRGPLGSINFITSHDGFTLRDLVSYEQKHNLANGENNRDGENHNHSRNYGTEGNTGNPTINLRRRRQMKNFWATLLLSQGVPMILHGDELGRTQNGNNNTYCQDNETSWMHWDKVDREVLDFAKLVTRLRREHPVFRRAGFFNGQPFTPDGRKDVAWLRTDGREMRDGDWQSGFVKSVGVLYDGDAPGTGGKDDHFLLLANASEAEVPFTLPAHPEGSRWRLVFDTVDTRGKAASSHAWRAGEGYHLAPGSLVLLQMDNPDAPGA